MPFTALFIFLALFTLAIIFAAAWTGKGLKTAFIATGIALLCFAAFYAMVVFLALGV